MVEEIARYGKFKNRDKPDNNKSDIKESVNKSVDKESYYSPDKWGTDIFNPFARYGI